MNWTKVKTSGESARVPRIFSRACEVFNFERSSRRYAFSIASNALGGKSLAFQAHAIHAKAARAARRDDFRERRHVLGDDGVRGDVGMFADAAELMHGAERADLRVVFDGDVAGESGAIHEDVEIAELAVVPDVRVRHDEIVAADARDAAAFYRAAIHRAEFVEFIVIADFDGNALAFVGEVLRIAADDSEGIDVVGAAQARGAVHDGVMIEDAAVAELDFFADDSEGADFCVLADLRGGRNDGAGINLTHLLLHQWAWGDVGGTFGRAIGFQIHHGTH